MANKINYSLEKLLSYLIDDKIIPKDVLPSNDIDLCDPVLIKCMEEGSEFWYDAINDELFIITDNGDKIKAPDLSYGTSTSSTWLCDYLPDVIFDIDQGGNVRRGDEAESCYKLVCIGYVISDFRNELIEFFKKYDYDLMTFKEGEVYNSFNQLLQYYQSLNSIRINSIISAASLKMSYYKEKNESFYTGLLESEEIIKLSTLSRELKTKISEYEKERGLNPYDIKNLSKVSKLKLIDERDREMDLIIERSSVATLYRISKLTSERIPAVIKSKVLREANRASKEYIKINNITGLDALDAENEYKRIVIKESYRAILKSIKANEVLKYKADPANYVLKTKS